MICCWVVTSYERASLLSYLVIFERQRRIKERERAIVSCFSDRERHFCCLLQYRRNTIRTVCLEKIGLVIILSNNHNKLGQHFLSKNLHDSII